MKVTFRFMCKEIVGDIENKAYELPGGCTIAEALDLLNKGGFVDNYLDFMLLMKNSKQAKPTDVLSDGDMVMVLRRVHGG